MQAHCADIYTRCDDTNRRLCNPAFFTKVFIDEDNELRVERNRPFEMLLDPHVNVNALIWAADAHAARTSTNVSIGKSSSLMRAVEVARQCSTLAPSLQSALSAHRAIRRRHRTVAVSRDSTRQLPKPVPRLTAQMLDEAERRYRGGEVLRVVAGDRA